MNASPFNPSQFYKSRQRLESHKQPFYDITNHEVFSSFHCIHGEITEWELLDMQVRALQNRRWGDTYVEPDLYPTDLQNFHRL